MGDFFYHKNRSFKTHARHEKGRWIMCKTVVKNSLDILARCPSCGAAKNADGSFDMSQGKVTYAAGVEGIPLEECGECTGIGSLMGGFPRRESATMNVLEHA